jgi:WD40 repeat protein
VITVAFSSSGSTLDVATTDGAISRFEVYGQWREAPACSAGTTLQDLSDIPLASAVDRAFAVLLSPVSDHAIALSRKGAIVVDVAKGERIRTLGGSYLPLGCFSSDGQTVFAIATRPIPSISSINVRTGVISNLSLRKDVQVHCTAIDISPDSKIAYLGYDDGTIHAIDIHSASDIWSLACGGQIVKYLKVSADGTTMLSSGDTGVLQLWNLNEHAELKNVVLNLSQPAVAAFSPRGDTILFSRPSDDAVCMWDTTLPKRLLDEESQIGKAREQLATDPTNAPARANIMSWFEMLGAYDWANHLLDEGDTDANLGIEAARCRWRVGNLTAAVEDFNALIQRGGSGLSLGYLRACRDAAARGE